MLNTRRLTGALLYLIVDIAYVLSSKSYYGNVVKKIQGSFMFVPNERLWAAAMSYLALITGWVLLVAPYVEQESVTLPQSALYGFIYGFAVYGVFNGTNHVMFRNYDASVVLRDMAWGVSWLTLFTLLYKLYLLKA